MKFKKVLAGMLLPVVLAGGAIAPAAAVFATDEVAEPAEVMEATEAEPILSEKMIAVFFVEGENEILPGGVVYLKEGGSIDISAKPVEGYEPVKIKVSYGFSGYEVEGSTLTINYEDVKMMTHIFIYVVYRKVTPPTTEAPKTTEQPKSETPKSTSSSTEAPKAEEPKVTPLATTKPEVTPPTSEAPKATEQSKSEASKSTSPTTEAPKTVEQKSTEQPKSEAPKSTSPTTAESQVTSPTNETPKTTEQKKALPNTGEAPSMLATISAILLGFVGLIGFNYKQEN